VKLIVRERGSAALVRWVADRRLISSGIARTEAARAIRRSVARRMNPLDQVFDAVTFVECDDEVLTLAANLEPPQMRTLDAIHVATALRSANDLESFVTYDERQSTAAMAAGLPVRSPS
jgi:uncharacterized protein